ncbi:MAG: hypothetical protein WDM88_01110 [Galbitalea sp.]
MLNDLAFVINGPELLDDRMTDRMLADVATLSDSSILGTILTAEVLDAGDAALRNQVMGIVSDFQWRGLNVEVTGDTVTEFRMAPEAVAAAAGGAPARPSRTSRPIRARAPPRSSSAPPTPTSPGPSTTPAPGSSVDSIAPDRLGLRSSIFGRVESAGGTVKVWSAPGGGNLRAVHAAAVARRFRRPRIRLGRWLAPGPARPRTSIR